MGNTGNLSVLRGHLPRSRGKSEPISERHLRSPPNSARLVAGRDGQVARATQGLLRHRCW
jgi:hypothetical protein